MNEWIEPVKIFGFPAAIAVYMLARWSDSEKRTEKRNEEREKRQAAAEQAREQREAERETREAQRWNEIVRQLQDQSISLAVIAARKDILDHQTSMAIIPAGSVTTYEREEVKINNGSS